MKISYCVKESVLVMFCAGAIFLAPSVVFGQGSAGAAAELEKLKKEYANIVLDRDNLLMQIKGMVEQRNKFIAAEAEYKKFEEEKKTVVSENESLKSQNMKLLERVGELETAQSQTVKERDELKNSLEKMMIEYKIVPETRKEIARVQNENNVLQKKNRQSDDRIKRLEEKRLNLEAQIEIYRLQIKDARRKYRRAMDKNKRLEKKAQALPVRFAQIARENKILIKETGLMHYNLGVFYTKNKEYSRAIAEFEKAIELNPDNPAAYFNLGYIYAEYILDRPMAIEKFRKYLSLVKTEDKDVDWVKRYILTWQTWEGKKPAE